MKVNLGCKWVKQKVRMVRGKWLYEWQFQSEHYYIVKMSNRYYSVRGKNHDNWGREITSGASLHNACKKMKLLEIAFEEGYECAKDIYREEIW